MGRHACRAIAQQKVALWNHSSLNHFAARDKVALNHINKSVTIQVGHGQTRRLYSYGGRSPSVVVVGSGEIKPFVLTLLVAMDCNCDEDDDDVKRQSIDETKQTSAHRRTVIVRCGAIRSRENKDHFVALSFVLPRGAGGALTRTPVTRPGKLPIIPTAKPAARSIS